jgi:hypothetical protein
MERVKTFRLEALKIEEGHCGIKHFDIVSFNQLLTDFECIVFLTFWGFEVHCSHEED